MMEPTESSRLQCPSFCSGLVARTVMGIVLLGLVAGGVYYAYGPDHGAPPGAAEAGLTPDGQAVSAMDPTVTLSPEKVSAAGIRWTPVKLEPLRHTLRVAGKLDYVASQVLDLRVPVGCNVKELLAEPGESLAEGAPVAVLSAVEVGRARDEVRAREADLQVAEMEHEWLDEIARNVDELVDFLDAQPEMDAIEERFAVRRLGSHRGQLLPAYSRLLLAERSIADSQPLAKQGVLSDRTLRERRSELEIARAEFRSICEQTRQEAGVARARAAAGLERAERLLRVSREHLATLLGTFSSLGAGSLEGGEAEREAERLNDFILRAPFAGCVQAVYAAPGLPVAANEPLFRFANTDTLWAAAQVHDRNWSALSVAAGHPVTVTSPALADQSFSGRVRFVGGAVSEENRTIPLVAELDNPDGQLKPGMFVWVGISRETPEPSLTVPAASLLRHEGETFVFVAEGGGSFRRTDVVTGLETPEGVEITEGLKEGQAVVDQGAFYLKSELLLEREE